MGATVTVRATVLMFVPQWLKDIKPLNPVMWIAGDPIYQPSRLTARVVTSAMAPTASGEIVIPPTREEATLDYQASVVGARRARKEAHAREMIGRMDRMDAKVERQIAKEARRIMMARRQQIIAAFINADMEEQP